MEEYDDKMLEEFGHPVAKFLEGHPDLEIDSIIALQMGDAVYKKLRFVVNPYTLMLVNLSYWLGVKLI